MALRYGHESAPEMVQESLNFLNTNDYVLLKTQEMFYNSEDRYKLCAINQAELWL